MIRNALQYKYRQYCNPQHLFHHWHDGIIVSGRETQVRLHVFSLELLGYFVVPTIFEQHERLPSIFISYDFSSWYIWETFAFQIVNYMIWEPLKTSLKKGKWVECAECDESRRSKAVCLTRRCNTMLQSEITGDGMDAVASEISLVERSRRCALYTFSLKQGF